MRPHVVTGHAAGEHLAPARVVLELVAGRFVRSADGNVVDLATGRTAVLQEYATAAGGTASDGRPDEILGPVIDAGWINARRGFAARWAQHAPRFGGGAAEAGVQDRVTGVLEMLDAPGPVRCCSIASAAAWRLEHAWLLLAREIRLRGLVPLSMQFLETSRDVITALRDRTVVLLVTPGGNGPAAVARAAEACAFGARLHAVIGLGIRWAGIPVIRLDLNPAELAYDRRAGSYDPSPVPLVADAPVMAGVGPAAFRSVGRASVPERVEATLQDAEDLLAAGRPRLAARAARTALVRAVDLHDDAAAIDALCLSGHAAIDLLLLADGARLLEAAFALARVACPQREDACRVALARCRAWQGRSAGVHALLADLSAGFGTDVGASAARLRAHAWMTQGRIEEAGALVGALLQVNERVPAARAATHEVAARLQIAAGDLAGASAHVLKGLRACRAAKADAREVALRAVWVEAVSRLGNGRQLRAAASALRRARTAVSSPLMRALAGRALALAARPRPARLQEQRASAAAICLRGVDERGPVVVEDLLELLMICHEAEDDGPALERLCAALRERLSASSVCVFGDEAAGRLISVGQPRGPSPETARRAVSTGQIVPAAVVCDGWEAAAPVRYGGQTIGAVSCRWPVDAALDPRKVERLMATAAAASAPGLRMALERRATPPLTWTDDLGLVGSSAAIARVRQAIHKAAAVPFQVLIEGESGSGKELVARAVHRAGPRRQRRLCAINCAALPDDLLEAELFGHTRGAFTGAVAERAGVFEEADGGTLFLDEVSELSPRAQAKLLRVLQESEVRRIGEGLPRRIDVRILAATNKTLAREADGGRFRTDLRYRLEVVRIVVPPLRERREDIPLLAGRFWADYSSRAGSRAILDRTTVDVLTRYDWPGNVRELQNVMAALAVHAPRRGRVVADDLPAPLRSGAWLPACTLDEARRAFDISFVREAMRRAGGRRTVVARELGLTRQGLAKLLARLGLAEERPEGGGPGEQPAAPVSAIAAAPRAGAHPAANA